MLCMNLAKSIGVFMLFRTSSINRVSILSHKKSVYSMSWQGTIRGDNRLIAVNTSLA